MHPRRRARSPSPPPPVSSAVSSRSRASPSRPYRPPARRSPPPSCRSPSRRDREAGGGRRSPRQPSAAFRHPSPQPHSPRRGSSGDGAREEAALRRELEQRLPARPRSPSRRQALAPRREGGSWRDDRDARPPKRESPRQVRPAGSQGTQTKKKSNKKKKKRSKVGSGGGAGGNQSGVPAVPPPNLAEGVQGTVSQAGIGTSRPQAEAGTGSPSRHQCFNCGIFGHFRSQCTQPECCMRCGDTGHRLASCSMPAAPPVRPRLDLLGHGVESIFYYIDLGGAPMSVPKNLAMVTVIPDQLPPVAEELTVKILRDELA